MRTLKYSACTNKGLIRENNEDCFLTLPERGLWAVADGMGGHEAGEVASAIVRDTLAAPGAESDLVNALQKSHKAVLRAAKQGIGASGMGSTAVALTSKHHDYQVSWVGDSRAYLWTQEDYSGRLEQLSTDHSYVQMLLASGAIQESELDTHPDKNVITQCIGSQELSDVTVDTVAGVWEKNQWILLCSDGLTDEVTDKDIARLMHTSKNTREAAESLMNAALDNGGRDNITIQVIESPLSNRNLSSHIAEWVPKITGHSTFDALLYGVAATSLSLLIYWVMA